MAINATFSGQLLVTDNLGSNPLVKFLSGFQFKGTTQTYSQNQLIGASPTTITLPISPTQVIYVANLHATQTLTVTWTPNGGSSNVVVTLQPTAMILHVSPNVTSGITALSLQGSGASTNCEFILVG
jgi:hypothetical protein